MELHCERGLYIFVCHTQLLSIWLLAWIISELSFKSLLCFSHSIIIYPKSSRASYPHTLATQFACLLSITDYPQNIVKTNNFVKYFTFDKTGYISIIHKKKNKNSFQTHSQQHVPGQLPKTIIILLVLFVCQTSSS